MKKDTGINYKSLKWLIGQPLEAIRVPHIDYMPDGEVKIVEDHEKGFLLDMEYVRTYGWPMRGSRHIRIMISKASIVCNDVILKIKSTGEKITTDMVVEAFNTDVVSVDEQRIADQKMIMEDLLV